MYHLDMNKISTIKKECKKCKEYFALDAFSKRDGKYTSVCLFCKRKRGREYYKNNKEKVDAKNREYAKNNKEKLSAYYKEYSIVNKEKIKNYHKEHKKKYPEKYKNWSRKYIAENKEKIKKYLKEWRSGRKDKINEQARARYHKNKDKILAQKRKKYNDNKEHMHEYQKQWRADHPDSVSKYLSKYQKNNLDKHAQKQHRRRAKIAQNGDDKYSVQDWKNLCNTYGNKCLCCGKTNIKLTVDHVLPIKMGGRNIIENIQPLCKSCNSKKGARHIDYRY